MQIRKKILKEKSEVIKEDGTFNEDIIEKKYQMQLNRVPKVSCKFIEM